MTMGKLRPLATWSDIVTRDKKTRMRGKLIDILQSRFSGYDLEEIYHFAKMYVVAQEVWPQIVEEEEKNG